MTKEEVKEYLKANLKLNVDWEYECKGFTIILKLEDEVIDDIYISL